MDCEKGLTLISARMDGELPPDERHHLTAHLSACASCRVAVDEWERDDRELAHIFRLQQRSATTVAERVMETWIEESTLPSRRWNRWIGVSAAAAGFALAFLLFGPRTWIGASNDDIGVRTTALVEQWKRSDAPYEIELRIRSMGDACAAPLAEVVQQWDGEANDARRLAMTRVLCDLADVSKIPTLIELLGDTSFEVRTLSEASLVRLTGRVMLDVDPILPPNPTAATCSNPQAEWREWWNANKSQFEPSRQ